MYTLTVFHGLDLSYARTAHRFGALAGGLVLPGLDVEPGGAFTTWSAHPDLFPRLPEPPHDWWGRFWAGERGLVAGAAAPLLVAGVGAGNVPDHASLGVYAARYAVPDELVTWRLPPAPLVGCGERVVLREPRRGGWWARYRVRENRTPSVGPHEIRVPAAFLGARFDPERRFEALLRGFFCRTLGWKQHGVLASHQDPYAWGPQATHMGSLHLEVEAVRPDADGVTLVVTAGLVGRAAPGEDRMELWNGRDGYACLLLLDLLQLPAGWCSAHTTARAALNAGAPASLQPLPPGREGSALLGVRGLSLRVRPRGEPEDGAGPGRGRLVRRLGWRLCGDEVRFAYDNRAPLARPFAASMEAGITALWGPDGAVEPIGAVAARGTVGPGVDLLALGWAEDGTPRLG